MAHELTRILGVGSAMGGLAMFGYLADNPGTLKVLSMPLTLLAVVSISVGFRMFVGERR